MVDGDERVLRDVHVGVVLEPHQAKHKEQAESMIKHIRAGIAVARADPAALVLFSGGATRANAGPLTATNIADTPRKMISARITTSTQAVITIRRWSFSNKRR